MPLIMTRVTKLALTEPPALDIPPPRHAFALDFREVRRIPLGYYRYLYDTVGREHHWTSRHMADERLSQELYSAHTRIFVLYADGAPAGWFELDAVKAPREIRIVHFAIMPDFRGQGLARLLLAKAIASGFEMKPDMLSLETNTLDHAAALPLYRSMGFRELSARDVVTPAIMD